MSTTHRTPEFLAHEFDMLREHVLAMKRACYDNWGQTDAGYKAHVICSNIEPMLAQASALIAKAGAEQ